MKTLVSNWNIQKYQNIVSIDFKVDSERDSTICKKIRVSELVSKVYEVYYVEQILRDF